jgi:hypothetical protein
VSCHPRKSPPLDARTLRHAVIASIQDGGKFDEITHGKGHILDQVAPLANPHQMLVMFENGQVFEVTIVERRDD